MNPEVMSILGLIVDIGLGAMAYKLVKAQTQILQALTKRVETLEEKVK